MTLDDVKRHEVKWSDIRWCKATWANVKRCETVHDILCLGVSGPGAELWAGQRGSFITAEGEQKLSFGGSYHDSPWEPRCPRRETQTETGGSETNLPDTKTLMDCVVSGGTDWGGRGVMEDTPTGSEESVGPDLWFGTLTVEMKKKDLCSSCRSWMILPVEIRSSIRNTAVWLVINNLDQSSSTFWSGVSIQYKVILQWF